MQLYKSIDASRAPIQQVKRLSSYLNVPSLHCSIEAFQVAIKFERTEVEMQRQTSRRIALHTYDVMHYGTERATS